VKILKSKLLRNNLNPGVAAKETNYITRAACGAINGFTVYEFFKNP